MLVNLNPQTTEQAKTLLRDLKIWLKNLSQKDFIENQYNGALDAVNMAILETRKYLRVRREGGSRNAETENKLSQLWFHASSQIRPYDSNLAELCMVKGHGWADDSVWSDPTYKDLPLEIDQILTTLRNLSKNQPPIRREDNKKVEQYLAFGFGTLFIIIILILAIFFPNPTSFQHTVFRIVLALAAAGFAAEIPGFLKVTVAKAIRAGGAIGVFVIVFFFSPANLAVNQIPINNSSHTKDRSQTDNKEIRSTDSLKNNSQNNSKEMPAVEPTPKVTGIINNSEKTEFAVLATKNGKRDIQLGDLLVDWLKHKGPASQSILQNLFIEEGYFNQILAGNTAIIKKTTLSQSAPYLCLVKSQIDFGDSQVVEGIQIATFSYAIVIIEAISGKIVDSFNQTGKFSGISNEAAEQSGIDSLSVFLSKRNLSL